MTRGKGFMEIDNFEQRVKELIKKYRWAKFVHNGRNLETGLDCLGFIILFYQEFGIYIPSDDGESIPKDWFETDPERYIRGIRKLGEKEVSRKELRPLDLAYFAISRNVITHTGIMLNNNEFIHMSPKRGLVINSLNSPWIYKYRGAIRIKE
jgi:cell wall-associated NlpC family hydrolase